MLCDAAVKGSDADRVRFGQPSRILPMIRVWVGVQVMTGYDLRGGGLISTYTHAMQDRRVSG